LNGVTIAVKAAAHTKKAKRPTKIQVIPLTRRRRFRWAQAGIETAGTRDPSKRTVSVYSATPSPRRKPQLRQNRNSEGIIEWQFIHFVTCGAELTAVGISVFCDI
jgi:hypothetical protein